MHVYMCAHVRVCPHVCVYVHVCPLSVCLHTYVCTCASCSNVPPGRLHGIAGGLSWFCRSLSRPCAYKQADTWAAQIASLLEQRGGRTAHDTPAVSRLVRVCPWRPQGRLWAGGAMSAGGSGGAVGAVGPDAAGACAASPSGLILGNTVHHAGVLPGDAVMQSDSHSVGQAPEEAEPGTPGQGGSPSGLGASGQAGSPLAASVSLRGTRPAASHPGSPSHAPRAASRAAG